MRHHLSMSVCNPYQRKNKWYDSVKGHTGEDRLYRYEDVPAPLTFTVLYIAKQVEMGLTLYCEDLMGNVHVFAHCNKVYHAVGATVLMGEKLYRSGNTGTKSTTPHEHYEIITPLPLNPEDKKMSRSLWSFRGYNTSPTKYLRSIYEQYNVDPLTLNRKEIPNPDWIKTKIRIPVPKWILTRGVIEIPIPKWLLPLQ